VLFMEQACLSGSRRACQGAVVLFREQVCIAGSKRTQKAGRPVLQ